MDATDLTEHDVIKRVLAEHQLDAGRTLDVLVTTLVRLHVGSKAADGAILEELPAMLHLMSDESEGGDLARVQVALLKILHACRELGERRAAMQRAQAGIRATPPPARRPALRLAKD